LIIICPNRDVLLTIAEQDGGRAHSTRLVADGKSRSGEIRRRIAADKALEWLWPIGPTLAKSSPCATCMTHPMVSTWSALGP